MADDGKTEVQRRRGTVPLGRGARPVLSTALTTGTRLGDVDQYEVLRLLAQDTGEADIYLCRDTRSDGEVAIKLYRGSQGAKDEVLRALRGLQHRGIVTLIDFGIWQGHLYEAMEYARGGSLAERLPDQPFTEEEIVTCIVPQVIGALELCHGMTPRIIHRDLKPSNIFFRDEARSEAVIGDFGISSLLQGADTHRATSSSRSPDYAAPEVYSGEMGIEADYYALGVTISELVGGRSPWAGRSDLQIMHGNISEEVPLPEVMSDRLRTLIRGLTVKERHHRWGSAEVRRWLSGEEVPVREPTAARASSPLPYTLPSGAKVSDAKEMATGIEKEWELIRADVARGHISRWFATFDQELARRLGLIEESGLPIDLQAFSFLYILDPARPVRLLPGRTPGTPAQLARAIDADDAGRAAGLEMLHDGRLTQWLRLTGYQECVALWESLPQATRAEPAVALEALLQLMDPDLSPPSVTADCEKVDFGRVEVAEQHVRRIIVDSPGRGHLAGAARLAAEVPGVRLTPALVRGRTELTVELDTSSLPAGARGSTTIEIETNADQVLSIPLSYNVEMPLAQSVRDCARWAGGGLAAFAGLRLLLALTGYSDWLTDSYQSMSVRQAANVLSRGDLTYRFEFVVVAAALISPLVWLGRRLARNW